VNYADLSTEVLHLLLAQRNLTLSGSCDTLLPPQDFGNPSQVASLLSSQPSISSSPLDVSPSLPKRLEEQILKGEFVDFFFASPG
jgi:hypothetical protein